MKARRLNAPSFWSVLYNQYHSRLRSISLYVGHWKAYQVITQPVVTLRMFGDLGIRQDHDVEATNLYRPDGLRDPKSPSVAEVESPNGYSLGAWNPVVQWRRR